MNGAEKITGLNELDKRLKNSGKGRIILTCGVFDLLKPSHIDLFETARGMGDLLVVGVYTSGLYTPLEERLEILAAVKYIDLIFPFSDIAELKSLSPLLSGIVTNDEFTVQPQDISFENEMMDFKP